MKTIYKILKPFRTLLILVILFCSVSITAQSQVETTVFTDDFSGSNLSGGTPAVTYSFLKQVISGTEPFDAFYNSGMFRIPGIKSSVFRNGVFGNLSAFSAPFNAKLSEIEADSIVWTFNFRANRETTNGYNDAEFGIATILLSDAASYSSANGYAVICYGSTSANRSFRLAKFTNGLDATSKFTDIINVFTGGANLYPSIRVTYIKSTSTWKFYARNDGSSFADPKNGTFTYFGSAVDNTFINNSMSHFGFFINCKSYTSDTNMDVDNFSVRTYHTDTASGLDRLGNINKRYRISMVEEGVKIKTISAKVTIYDITGREKSTVNVAEEANLIIKEKGIYLLKIELPDAVTAVDKIIIQ